MCENDQVVAISVLAMVAILNVIDSEMKSLINAQQTIIVWEFH